MEVLSKFCMKLELNGQVYKPLKFDEQGMEKKAMKKKKYDCKA